MARIERGERVLITTLTKRMAEDLTDYLMEQLETTPEGCLAVDENMQTAVPGIYAIGDLLCSHIKQAVVAASDGGVGQA